MCTSECLIWVLFVHVCVLIWVLYATGMVWVLCGQVSVCYVCRGVCDMCVMCVGESVC